MLKRRISFFMCFVLLVYFSFFIASQPVGARTTVLADGLYATIREAIDQASPGDTIVIPAGQYSIKRPVLIDKSVIIKGSGIENTTISVDGSAAFTISANNVRIEGIKFLGKPGRVGEDVTDIGGQFNDRAIDVGNVQDFCIIDCDFVEIGRAGVVVTGADARGVISGSKFIDIFAGSGVVVYGGGHPNWERPLELGTENAVFVEDCYFLRNMHAIASNDGSKYVFRYNEVIDTLKTHQAVDAHGLEYGSTRGSRSYEIYNNFIDNDSPHYAGVWIRGGDGLIFNNTINNCTHGILVSNLTQTLPEGASYPYKDQTHFLYAWRNTLDDNETLITVRNGHEEFLQEGRDFYNIDYTTVDESYSPYTYPHPLTLDSAWEEQEPEEWQSSADFSEGVQQLGDGNTGSLLVKFDLDHGDLTTESIIGYANSGAAVNDAQSLFAKIRAYEGVFTASNGDSYEALATVSYEAFSCSFVKILVDFDKNTYDVWVTPEGGTEIQLARGYELGDGALDMGQICIKGNVDGDFSVIDHSIISYTPQIYIPSDKYSANSFTKTVDEIPVQREDGLCTFTPVDGEILVEFDFVPYADNINGVVGFAGPDTFISEYANFSFMFRAYINGSFDAYNYNTYTSANNIPYSANTQYHVRMLIDMGAETYNAWVTPDGGEEIKLTENYAFRAATVPKITELGKIFLRSTNDEDFGISNLSVTKVGPGTPPEEEEPIPGDDPVSELITNLIVNDTNNASLWSINTNLQEGDKQYGDRAFTLTSIPSELLGADWISPANASKGYTSNPVVATFDVTANSYVYVAYSDQITNKWINSGWKDTGLDIVNSEPKSYRVYRKFYPAGSTVELGYNGTASYGNYFVIVKERVLIDELDVKDTDRASSWSVKTNLQEGDVQYGDRTFTLTYVPPIVAGCDWISPANASKGYTQSPVATFKVTADSYVYVAYHNDIDASIRWITPEWEDTDEDIINSEGTPQVYSLYRKYFPKGATVTLGPNGTTDKGNYFVIVKEFEKIEIDQVNDISLGIGENVSIDLNSNVTGVAIDAVYNSDVAEITVNGDNLIITGIGAGMTDVVVTVSHEDYVSTEVSFNVNVVAAVDKSALNTAITEAQDLVEEDYTPETWEDFTLTLSQALAVQADENASQAEVDEATSSLIAAMNALCEIDLIIGDESEGGAGKVRTITIGKNTVCEYLIVQFTEGTGVEAKVSVIMISPTGRKVTISYQKSETKIDVWAASGMPNLTGGDMGVEITASASVNPCVQ